MASRLSYAAVAQASFHQLRLAKESSSQSTKVSHKQQERSDVPPSIAPSQGQPRCDEPPSLKSPPSQGRNPSQVPVIQKRICGGRILPTGYGSWDGPDYACEKCGDLFETYIGGCVDTSEDLPEFCQKPQ